MKNPVSKGESEYTFVQMQKPKGIPEQSGIEREMVRPNRHLPNQVSPRWLTLLRYAESRRHESAAMCEGLCFHETVVLARYASQMGLADRVLLVCWDVRGDAKYRQHWALLLENCYVLDPTGIQVDGSSRLIRAMEDYPGSYRAVGSYPVSAILGAIDTRAVDTCERYPKAVLWRVFRAMAMHDVRLALNTHQVFKGLVALGRLCTRGIILTAAHLLDLTLERLHRILRQLK
jgi:hypothetical protein